MEKVIQTEEENLHRKTQENICTKGLFINDVINFGGYRDPPPPPRHHSSLFGYPPLVRVTLDNTVFATKHRMLGS